MKVPVSHLAVLAATVSAQEVVPDAGLGHPANCVPGLRDAATGNCVGVSSVPTMGMLYPLGPDFYFGANGQLQVANLHLRSGGRMGIGTTLPGADVHVFNRESAEIVIEADWDNWVESDQPKLTLVQDGGAVQGFLGFQDGQNDLSLRSLYTAGGMRFDLYTGSTRDWEFRRRASTATDVEARFTQSGNLELDGSVSSPAADVAEFYPVLAHVEPGDVVAFAGDEVAIERAAAGNGTRLAGIVSSNPGVVLGLSYTDEEEDGPDPDDLLGDDRFVWTAEGHRLDRAIQHEIDVNRRAPLALTGRVPCKVSAENGPIRAGDLLTVASLAGHAMKATQAGPVIGTALEGQDAGEGTILVLANLGWFSPTADLDRRVAELERQVRALRAAR